MVPDWKEHQWTIFKVLLGGEFLGGPVVRLCTFTVEGVGLIPEVHGILQARILEWVAFPFSRGSSQPRDRTQVSHIAGSFFTSWATREANLWMEGSMKVTFLRVCENGDTVTGIISDYGFVGFSQYLLGYFVFFSVLWDCMIKCVGFFFFWSHYAACGNLSSLTRDQTHAPCSGSTEL